MAVPVDVSLDQEVHDGLVDYLEREFGTTTRAKSLIVNLAVRQFLERKGIMLGRNPEPSQVLPKQSPEG